MLFAQCTGESQVPQSVHIANLFVVVSNVRACAYSHPPKLDACQDFIYAKLYLSMCIASDWCKSALLSAYCEHHVSWHLRVQGLELQPLLVFLK